MITSTQRHRCFSGTHSLTQLVFLSAISTILIANSSEINHHEATERNVVSNQEQQEQQQQQQIEQHYFTHEIDFLAKQSMILGNYYHDDDADQVSTNNSTSYNAINRLEFIEKSLQMELDFIRRLRVMKNSPDEILADIKSTAATTANSTELSDEIKSDEGEQKTVRVSLEIMTSTISEATWPTWAFPSSNITDPTLIEDHKYDYDWIRKNGYGILYNNLECYDHAYNQNKPMYTPENWHKLWQAFRESTLFPFPISSPNALAGRVYHVGRTTDGKGRGNFASRNITKGSLVHPGHPNTVFFSDNNAWFRFLAALPKMLACDAMEWVWQQDLTSSGNVVLCLNLDEAVFFNHGDGNPSANMELKDPTSLDFYATRDIEMGGELMYDYDQFDFDPLEMDL